ncbi:MAG: hypothetical protein A2Y28_01045 [Chlamydiae bacterium GWC2_50_10]|nr:MAG: hypothetical protein A2Z85_03310 [Chlamydiae bacterium GWA2_50_15]OGN53758.1 MAG: hypothetical protein A2Y28_01045 [Chlamydiae bacterium GWC2_50_10]OGN54821.1 MAG: hypothetical protein A2098_03830 [Chlamydiae bacterium GWF2_49_8]OGN58611.1 MAG: hypothetical protein A3D18_04600 [Chlamydiae bacterium RIFCSPHIGHO2_02_FULL_49_29]OGN63819.1 MAG: hypothetical protein A3E26_00960 [Chlamydiae bacterium RIFCSPHIGHO2_12_FULL_49_32]OGN70252.1 MAG: hypothetical protein A3I15_02435 [Chlamydiae bact
MNPALFLRLLICLTVLGGYLYWTIDQQNEITQLRIALPQLAKEIDEIREENTLLRYEIESFENPLHLLQLSRLSSFSHLKQPLSKEIFTIREGEPLSLPSSSSIQEISIPSKLSLAAILLHVREE